MIEGTGTMLVVECVKILELIITSDILLTFDIDLTIT